MDFSNYKKIDQDYLDDKFVIYNKKIYDFDINICIGDWSQFHECIEFRSDPLDINLSLDSYKKFGVLIFQTSAHDQLVNQDFIIKIGLDKLNLKIKNLSNTIKSSYVDVTASKLEAIENLLMEYSKNV